jgi:hypothetical protein
MSPLNKRNEFEKDEVSATCRTEGEMTNAYTVLVGRPKRKIPFVRFRRR